MAEEHAPAGAPRQLRCCRAGRAKHPLQFLAAVFRTAMPAGQFSQTLEKPGRKIAPFGRGDAHRVSRDALGASKNEIAERC